MFDPAQLKKYNFQSSVMQPAAFTCALNCLTCNLLLIKFHTFDGNFFCKFTKRVTAGDKNIYSVLM